MTALNLESTAVFQRTCSPAAPSEAHPRRRTLLQRARTLQDLPRAPSTRPTAPPLQRASLFKSISFAFPKKVAVFHSTHVVLAIRYLRRPAPTATRRSLGLRRRRYRSATFADSCHIHTRTTTARDLAVQLPAPPPLLATDADAQGPGCLRPLYLHFLLSRKMIVVQTGHVHVIGGGGDPR